MLTTVSSFYTKYVVPMSPVDTSVFMGSIFLVAIPISFAWAKVALKLGSGRSMMAATALCTLTLLLFLIDHSAVMVIATGVPLGFSISGFLVLLNVLLAEVIDALTTGKRREGMYLGMNGFIVRIGLSVQYAIMAGCFALSGYNANVETQAPRTVEGFRVLEGALPALLLVIALLFLNAYQGQVKADPKDVRV